MLTTLKKKLAWRVRFIAGDNPFDHVTYNPFPLRQRLAYVASWGRVLDLGDLLDQCHERGRDGEPYFRLDGLKVYYRPDGPVEDEARLLWGVKKILHEAYLNPQLLCPEVKAGCGDVMLDLGGNIGTSAMAFARQVGPAGRVHSFEPVTPDVVARNARANGFGNITVVPLAVADAPGQMQMSVGDGYIDSSLARKSGGRVRQRMVEVTTVDRYVAEQRLDRLNVIKMDIEGAEELALRGAAETIRRFRPRWTIASYHTDHVGDKQHPKLVRLLDEVGYTVREVGQARIFAW